LHTQSTQETYPTTNTYTPPGQRHPNLATEHTNPNTMADTTRVTRKAKEDLLRDSQSTIKGPDSAKKWLIDNELMLKGEDLSMSTLAAALFQLCSGKFTLPKDMVSGMRAIALCMEEIIQIRYTSDALDTIKEQVEDIVKEVKESIEV